MIDWKAKLTSRKLWMAFIGFLTGLLTFLGVGVEEAENVGSLVLMGVSVLSYIIGEGLIDAASAKSGGTVILPGVVSDDGDEEEEDEDE